MRRGNYYTPNIGALNGDDGKKILEIIKNTTPPDLSVLEKEVRNCEQKIMAVREDEAKRESNLLNGALKYMADDFDETPDCFKEYM